MTIDMKKIRPGCIVPCRERVVESVNVTDDFVYPYEIKFKGDYDLHSFDKDGFYCSKDEQSILDITSIIEPPFDWDQVKPGDMLKHYMIGDVFYIGPCRENKNSVWVEYTPDEAIITEKHLLSPP